jgi:hypothetical protein
MQVPFKSTEPELSAIKFCAIWIVIMSPPEDDATVGLILEIVAGVNDFKTIGALKKWMPLLATFRE